MTKIKQTSNSMVARQFLLIISIISSLVFSRPKECLLLNNSISFALCDVDKRIVLLTISPTHSPIRQHKQICPM